MPPHLILLRHGKPVDQFELSEGRQTLGRSEENHIALPHPSISRRHAEVWVEDGVASITDLQSSNGLLINNVPRKQASLQEGDRILLGSIEMLYGSAQPISAVSRLGMALETEVDLHKTQRFSLRLPDAKPERHLAAFYHLCAWVTDGVDEENGLPRWLELLVESLRAHTVQFYRPDGDLTHVFTSEQKKPRIKFAPYLLEKFRALPEATHYSPRELDRFQQRLGQYHYLIAPLRLPQTTPSELPPASCPVVALLRPAEWEPFSPEDRVLLQSACQMWLRSVYRAAEIHRLRDENTDLRRQASMQEKVAEDGLLGSSAAIKKLQAQIKRTAATKATVLIHGETGSGKEVVATAVHHHSPRSAEAFVKINCGAIPGGLIESELFGHAKGAFTDARTDRKGKFLQANRGTLFFDEIGELPLAAQTKLLRVLEEKTIDPLGSDRPRKVDVRVVAATNRDLAEEVASGHFRQDLFYRLNVVTLMVPPLREHVEDIPVLAQFFLETFTRENGLADLDFSSQALTKLKRRKWDGNVRELRNVVQRLAIEATGPSISVEDVDACR